jgi:outer membrane lipoprotein-sorting protein
MMTRPRTVACGCFGLSLLLMVTAATAGAEEADARALVQRVMDALPKVPFVAKLDLSTAQGSRTVELNHKFVDGARASYLELVAPEDLKGIRFLFLERTTGPSEQYMKVAAARTFVRVADEVRKQPFLGSTFYISDLIEPPIDAFTYKFIGEDKVLDRQAMLVEAVPKKPNEQLYGRIVMALDPKDLLVLRRQFYDHKGQILKVWTVEKIEKIDGTWTLMEHRMRNTQTEESSRLTIKEIKYNVELPDAMFTPKYLLH